MSEQFADSTSAQLLELVSACAALDWGRPTPPWWEVQRRAVLDEEPALGAWLSRHDSQSANDPDDSNITRLVAALVHADECFGAFALTLRNVSRALLRLHLAESAFSDRVATDAKRIAYDMAYGLSHELNNPLANIATRARLLAEGETDARKLSMLAAIVDQAMRGGEMLGDLMLYARPPQLETVETPMAEFLADFVRDARPWIQSRGLEFVDQSCTTCVTLSMLCDPKSLREALWAILRNAIEAAKSRITLSAKRSPTSRSLIYISVIEDGLGFSDQALERAFHPYYSGREAGRGLGLGLPKARRIAELHGGSLHVHNLPTGGSEACLAIPLIPSPSPPSGD
ncbi:MAG: HAMP domain-containing sensor histidine kinase [Pirellulales bacterium]